MFDKRIVVSTACALALFGLTACQATTAPGSGAAVTSIPGAAVTVPAAADSAAPASAAASAGAISITLAGDAITADSPGVAVAGSVATIQAAGTYRLSGNLADGQIVVDAPDAEVTLILAGANLRSSTSAPLNIVDAKAATLLLADGTENYVADAASYVYANPGDDEPNAAIFSDVDLTVGGGGGALLVAASFNDGIASKDDLTITGGAITVNAVDDGIRGKDSLVIEDGVIAVTAGGDGLKADQTDDPATGHITIENGKVTITAGGDAMQAETALTIANGDFTLTTGGGSSVVLDDDAPSAKGIKGVGSVAITGGTFAIDAADDAIRSDGTVTLDDGVLTIASGDDGVQADVALTVNGGDMRITRSVEGLESALITINDGEIRVTASDDGVNVSGDDAASEGRPPLDSGQPPGQAAESYTGDRWLYIHGGYLVVDAQGDGLDANGAIQMTGGTVIVNGPTGQDNGAIDYDAIFDISGGQLIAAGSAGEAQTTSASSSQNSVLIVFDAPQSAGTLVHIQDSTGNTLLTFAPAKAFQSLVFSAPELVTGAGYEVFLGGSADGAVSDGLYTGASYTPGELAATFAVEGPVAEVGNLRGRP